MAQMQDFLTQELGVVGHISAASVPYMMKQGQMN